MFHVVWPDMVWCTLILSYLWKPTTAVGSQEEISLESNTASQPSMGKRTMPLCHSPTAPWKCTLFSDTMLNLPGHWIRAASLHWGVCLEVRLLFRLLPSKHQITRYTDALNARCARVCLRCHVGLLLQFKSAAFVVLLGESAGIRGEHAHVRILPVQVDDFLPTLCHTSHTSTSPSRWWKRCVVPIGGPSGATVVAWCPVLSWQEYGAPHLVSGFLWILMDSLNSSLVASILGYSCVVSRIGVEPIRPKSVTAVTDDCSKGRRHDHRQHAHAHGHGVRNS